MAQEGKVTQQFPHLDGSRFVGGEVPRDGREESDAPEYEEQPGVDPQAPDLTADDDKPARTRTSKRS